MKTIRSARGAGVLACALLLACEGSSVAGGPSSPQARVPALSSSGQTRPTPAQGTAAPKASAALLRGAGRERWRIDHLEERIIARTQALRLLELLRELKGDAVELVSVVRDGEVRRVTLIETGSPTRAWTEIITVQGGRWLVDPVDLLKETRQGKRAREFAACLRKAGARVYVKADDEASARQLRALGPVREGLVVRCPGDSACKRSGDIGLPVFEVGGRRYAGPRARPFIEAATGCK